MAPETKLPEVLDRRGRRMEVSTFTATEAKNEFGRALDAAATGDIVVITRHETPRAVLVAFDRFAELVTDRSRPIDVLREEFDQLLVRMQTPEARAGMESAFQESPEALGKAALARASKARASRARASKGD